MNPQITKFIAHVSAEIRRHGGAPTKTRVLKLLYLFDVAYYRRHRKTFTGFEWVFLHYGPWSEVYDTALGEGEREGFVSIAKSDQAEFINTSYSGDVSDLGVNIVDELALRRLIENWADTPLNQLLDYVYFDTEPMIRGERYQKLDFSTIDPAPPDPYKRSHSGRSQEEILRMRHEIDARLNEIRARRPDVKQTQQIQYDDVFFDGIRAFEEID